jgi:hypothetical protein
VPSLLADAVVRRHERDGLVPAADFAAAVRRRSLASDLPRPYRPTEGLVGEVVRCGSGSPRPLGVSAFARCRFRAESGSFVPASPATLFLIPADCKRMAIFVAVHPLSLAAVLRAIVPEGKGVLCLKFIVLRLRSRNLVVVATRAQSSYSSRCSLCFSSATDTSIGPRLL